MIIGDTDFFSVAERKLDWLDRRSNVLAGDVANANTPGFVARDLSPFAAQLSPFSLALTRTNERDLAGNGDGDGDGETVSTVSSADERAPDRNAVSLDHTLAAVAATDDAQREVSTLYRKYAGLEMTALGAGTGG